MPQIRNESSWETIMDMEVFTNKELPQYEKAWRWLESLQNGNLTKLQIIQIEALLLHVFEAGRSLQKQLDS